MKVLKKPVHLSEKQAIWSMTKQTVNALSEKQIHKAGRIIILPIFRTSSIVS